MCTHMICSWPVWTWFVLPVIIMAILAMFLLRDKVLKKKKELKAAFLTIFLGGYMGLLFSGAGHIIFIFTNNMFAYKKPYERMAWVRGKHRITISRGPDKYNTYLFFVDNNERFPLDDFDVFNHVNQGDTVVVTLQDGFWGVPIIKKVDKLISGF